MTEAIKTIPEIKAEAETQIWAAVEAMLERNREQQEIAEVLGVSTSWLSRYLKKNVEKMKANKKISDWAYRCVYASRWK